MKLNNKSSENSTIELQIVICLILDEQVFDIHEFLQTGDTKKLKRFTEDLHKVMSWYPSFNPFVVVDYELASGDVLDMDVISRSNWKLYINKIDYLDFAKNFNKKING